MNPAIAIKVIAGGVCAISALASPLGKTRAADLASFRQLKPDVVIMDLMMPGMDGIDTTRQIIAETPSAKILLLTTFDTSNGIAKQLNLRLDTVKEHKRTVFQKLGAANRSEAVAIAIRRQLLKA